MDSVDVCLIVFHATFSNISAQYIMATSFSGGESRRQSPTMDKQPWYKLYHLRLRVEYTLFCNLQSRARIHAVMVIGLYELLGNPSSNYLYSLSHPDRLVPFGFRRGLCQTDSGQDVKRRT